MNRVILSFDYEIYFDGSNRYNILIDNTRHILRLASDHKVGLVFFVDVYYLIKLEETSQTEVFQRIKEQVQDIVSQGHEIQYHFHPHWINASYSALTDSWEFNKSESSFSDIYQKYGSDKTSHYFSEGLKKLKEYSGSVPIAFRAGGLSVEKNQDALISLLKEHKLKYDSSVMPGLFLPGEYIYSDHRKAPETDLWSVNENSGFYSSATKTSDCITEIPVMTLKNEYVDKLKGLITSMRYRSMGLFLPGTKQIAEENGKPFDLGIKSHNYPISITFDKSGRRDILLLKFFTDQFFTYNKKIMCILSHPKSFYKDSFIVLEKYLKWVSLPANNISIVNFRQLES